MTDSVPPGPGGEVNRPAESGHRLVEASLSPNTRRAYRGALRQLDAWLEGRPLDDATLAVYLGALHEAGRAPATAALVVAATAFPISTPPPAGCGSSSSTAQGRPGRPRGGFCERHGKSYLTLRRRGGEGGGGGLLTGRAIPSAYRWAWCRWYSRVVESQYASKVAAGFVAPGA